MKVLLVHTRYQLAGGEDVVFEQEARLLESRGHIVIRYERSNDELNQLSRLRQFEVTVWNNQVIPELRQILRDHSPDVAHFHNTFAVISPAAYRACKLENVPVVQTLHNYRLICPNALLYRDGHPCTDCIGRSFPWPGVLHRCYRGSRVASSVVATMLARNRKVFQHEVDKFICLTAFSAEKHIQGGIPREKIVVKPNFLLDDPGVKSGRLNHAIFVGRLTPEKGADLLIQAWLRSKVTRKLIVVGAGPMAEELRQMAGSARNIEFVGALDAEEVRKLQQTAAFALMTSRVYEGAMPLAVIEALACGTPVIGPHHGAIPEIGDAGWTYKPENIEDLASLIARVDADGPELARAQASARKRFEQSFTAEQCYETLMSIYGSVSKG